MKRIESRQNALVKHWIKLSTTRKEREKTGEFIVEGFHLVEEALKSEGTVLHLIVRDDLSLPASFPLEGVQLIEIPSQIAKDLAETEQTQGIFAHCKQQAYDEASFSDWKKILLIDSVQDPGNVGTMIRTADAAGMDAVILGKGSADLYNPKTLRSSQGSHFHLPVVKGDLEEWTDRVKRDGLRLIGTGLTDSVDYGSVECAGPFALLVGNEGSGVDPLLLGKADDIVKIPLHGKAESLNVAVATGILLYAYAASGSR